MNRRNFLKALGLGGSVSTLSACGLDDNRYYTPVEQILPYVTRPEQVTPGMPSHIATTVSTGPSAWPVVAVHRDGRVINVGVNPEATKAGFARAVSSSFLFDLQRHYSPDRIQSPAVNGQAASWDDAVSHVSSALTKAKESGKKVGFVGRYRSGAIVDLIQRIADDQAVLWEPLGLDAEAEASQALFGTRTLPRYDLSTAHYVLSFGAAYLSDAWGSPAIRNGWAEGRNPNIGHFVARSAAVTPHRDQTAANADDWYACAPGTEAQVAWALARMVAERNRYAGPARALLRNGDANAASAASGLSMEQLNAIADRFAKGHAVALPGGAAGASVHATSLAAATYVLNLVAKATEHFMPGGYDGPIASFADLEALLSDLEAGQIGVLFVDDLDLLALHPDPSRVEAAIAKAGLSVSTSGHASETQPLLNVVLPVSTSFEDWGHETPRGGLHLVRQPSMAPLYDSRSLGDVLLSLLEDDAPAPSWAAFVRSHVCDAAGAAVDDDTWWHATLVQGFVEVEQPSNATFEWTGQSIDAGAGAPNEGLTLQVFPHHFLLDGRYANEPWAQEIPDPMTGQVWDTWALVHPSTAATLRVADNDLLAIQTENGSIEVGVEVHPCVAPNVIAVPMGGGRNRAAGRYAEGHGANVMNLLAATTGASGVLAMQGTSCTASATGRKAELVSTFGHDHDNDRMFAMVVDADKLAKVGDEPTDHPGELTGRHHLEMDKRLQANDINGFYGLPDHPTYRFGLTVDTNACTGCGACAVACYAENNLPVIGKQKVREGREMSWLRVNRYYADHTSDENPSVHFSPMMCQQCGHAPCESVCPVLATYHTIDGLNAMVYNRCAGTRYCSNACPYSARKFNYHTYVWPEPFQLQLNPDVVTRTMGVMEKCTFCVQRIRRVKSAYRDMGVTNTVPNEALEQLPACAEACDTQALTFGNINDPASTPAKTRKSGRNHYPIEEINTYPAVNYLARASYHAHLPSHGEGHHGAGEHHEDDDHHPASDDAGAH